MKVKLVRKHEMSQYLGFHQCILYIMVFLNMIASQTGDTLNQVMFVISERYSSY